MVPIDYDGFLYYTYEQYKTWDDSWELIDGVPYAMSPAPYPKHQKAALLQSPPTCYRGIL